MIETIEKEGKECVRIVVVDKEYFLTEPELVSISRGIVLRELEFSGSITFEDYRLIKREYKRLERDYLKRGQMIHFSKYDDKVWKLITEEYEKEHGRYPEQKGYTYVKRAGSGDNKQS